MNTPQRFGTAVVAAVLGLGVPLAASAQQQSGMPASATPTSGDTTYATFQGVIARRARNTGMLASMTNHISVHDISLIPVNNMRWSASQRSWFHSSMGDDGYRALQAALSKATVADVDRTNGQSEDQSSLADYLLHEGINPHSVVAVDIESRNDALNPHVTVYYHMHGNNPVQTPAGAG